MNEELTFAIDELRQRPKDRRWFIPVVVSGSVVPDRSIGGGETLRDVHWLDLSDGWDVAVDVIAGMLERELPQATPGGWEELSRQVAPYSPTPLQESLERGALAVPDYRFEETLFTVARACQQSVRSVSYDDRDLWCVAEPRSRRYQTEKNSGLMRGFRMSRILVIQKQTLLHAMEQIHELLLDHLFRHIGLATVISEHVPEDRRHPGHEFAIFDGRCATIGSRESPWVLVCFDTAGAAVASDRLFSRQLWLYDWLTDHVIMMTDEFLRQHPRVATRQSAGESVITITPDDIEEQLDQLYLVLRSGSV